MNEIELLLLIFSGKIFIQMNACVFNDLGEFDDSLCYHELSDRDECRHFCISFDSISYDQSTLANSTFLLNIIYFIFYLVIFLG